MILPVFYIFFDIFVHFPTKTYKTPGRLLFIICQVYFFHIRYYQSFYSQAHGWTWIIWADNSSIHTAGVTLFSSWLWFSSDSTLDCICRANFFAPAAADALRTVRVFHRVHDHLAGFCTFSAFYTLILIHSVFIQGNRIKYGIKCSQGTDIFAKRTVD